MHYRMYGRIVELCRWQVTYTEFDREMVAYCPTEEEADTIVARTGGVKTALDTEGYDWIDGIETDDVPDTMAAAREIIRQGRSAYLNRLHIPTAEASAVALMRSILPTVPLADDTQKLTVSGLYDDWTAGSYAVGDIRNAMGQTWECFQAHDNAVYPDIAPDNAAWLTFWRPLHGTSPETARPFVTVHGAHDMYRAGEYMTYEGQLYRCVSDTSYSPTDQTQAWEVVT